MRAAVVCTIPDARCRPEAFDTADLKVAKTLLHASWRESGCGYTATCRAAPAMSELLLAADMRATTVYEYTA